MKKYILLLLAFLFVPALHAQPRFKVPKVSGVTGAVSRQAVRSELNNIGRAATAPVTPATKGIVTSLGGTLDAPLHTPEVNAATLSPEVTGALATQTPRAGLVGAFHSSEDDFLTASPIKERPPLWEMMGGSSAGGGSKMSALRLRIALAEEHALPANSDDWDRDSLQEFYDTYMALKSGAGVAARFNGAESERKAWARTQPDYLEENYVYEKYTKPFNEHVNQLRILVVNDKRQPLEPLLEAAAKDPRVDVTWAMSPKGVIAKLQSGYYDVVLCDYVMRGGTADLLGMNVYNQKLAVPVVLYSAAGATADYLISHNILGRMDIALTGQEAKSVFNYLSNLTVWYRQATAPKPTGVSELGYYHLLGNDNAPTMPAWAATSAPSVRARPLYTAKRSRESLELELTANGFRADLLEKYSRDEMKELLSSYKAFMSAKDVPSRYEYEVDYEAQSYVEQLKQLETWAKAQPDYFEDNYLDFDEVDEEYEEWNYAEPFNPVVTSLRILVVRDDLFGVMPLVESALKHPGVTVDHATDVSHALDLLSRIRYDIVLTDYVLGEEHNGFEISMYVWNKKLHIPVVSYALMPMHTYTLLKYNIVGEIPVVETDNEAERALNYLSNVAATGRAYPNK